MKTPKPPRFEMYSDEINSRVTYNFYNLVVDPIKVSNTIQRFWRRPGSKLDDYFRNRNFIVEVYSFDMKTIAFLVADMATVAVSKATVREGDTYNATIGAEVAITSLLRKVINKDFRKVSKEDMKTSQKAYDQWLNSEKYNCGNPECEACNAAMGAPAIKKAEETYLARIPTDCGIVTVEFKADPAGRAVDAQYKIINSVTEAARYTRFIPYKKISV